MRDGQVPGLRREKATKVPSLPGRRDLQLCWSNSRNAIALVALPVAVTKRNSGRRLILAHGAIHHGGEDMAAGVWGSGSHCQEAEMDAGAQITFSFFSPLLFTEGRCPYLGGGGGSPHFSEHSLQRSSQSCQEACLLGELDLSGWPY